MHSELLKKGLDLVVRLHVLLLASSAALVLLAVSPNRLPLLEQTKTAILMLPNLDEDSASTARFDALGRAYAQLLSSIRDTINTVLDPIRLDRTLLSPSYDGGVSISETSTDPFWNLVEPQPSASVREVPFPGRDRPLREQLASLREIQVRTFPLPDPDTLGKVLRSGTLGVCEQCEVLFNAGLDTVNVEAEYQWVLLPVDSIDSFGEPHFSDHQGEIYLKTGRYEPGVWQSELLSEQYIEFLFTPVPVSHASYALTFGSRERYRYSVVTPDTLQRVLRAWAAIDNEWPEFVRDHTHLTRTQALQWLEGEMAKENRTLSMLGLSLDEKNATVGGPLLMAFLLTYTLFVLVHLRRLSYRQRLLSEYPWPPLFAGVIGSTSNIASAIIPIIAIGAFLHRVVGQDGTRTIPDTPEQWVGAALFAWCIAVTILSGLQIRMLRKSAAVPVTDPNMRSDEHPAVLESPANTEPEPLSANIE